MNLKKFIFCCCAVDVTGNGHCCPVWIREFAQCNRIGAVILSYEFFICVVNAPQVKAEKEHKRSTINSYWDDPDKKEEDIQEAAVEGLESATFTKMINTPPRWIPISPGQDAV